MPKAFDNIAANYDYEFTHSKIGKAQRAIVHKVLAKYFKNKENLSILEINCGTGEDAVFMSEYSDKIIATDISEKMLEIAKKKAGNTSIKFQVLDINELSETNFTEKFDLIFSNFGGLNCLSKNRLKAFFKSAYTLLNTNGSIIAVFMPKYCFWEIFYFLLRGKFKQAFRRTKKEGIPVTLNNEVCHTWYYNPNEVKKLSKPNFNSKKLNPVGIAIPPSYLENSILTKRPWFSVLLLKEKILSYSIFSKLSDHYLIQLQKQ